MTQLSSFTGLNVQSAKICKHNLGHYNKTILHWHQSVAKKSVLKKWGYHDIMIDKVLGLDVVLIVYSLAASIYNSQFKNLAKTPMR